MNGEITPYVICNPDGTLSGDPEIIAELLELAAIARREWLSMPKLEPVYEDWMGVSLSDFERAIPDGR